MNARERAALAMLAAAAVGALIPVADAHRRRSDEAGRRAAVVAVAARLPWPDLAVAGGARHLRFVSLEEPGAAFADGPAMLDAEPAGGVLAPPRDVWVEEARAREAPR